MRLVSQGLRIEQTSKTTDRLMMIRLGIRSDTHIRDRKITNAIIKQKHLNKNFISFLKDQITSFGQS